MVDLGSLILLMSIFGAKVAVIYVIVGLMIAVAGGTLIEKLHMEPYVEEFVRAAGGVDIESPTLTKRERIQYAREQVVSTFKKVFPYILVGVGIGAIIHNWIPESWIEAVLGGNNPFGVVLATLVGIPMYADIFGTIPVAEALLYKGAQLGTILSFMMAVYWYLHYRYHPCGLPVQCVSIFAYIIFRRNQLWDFLTRKKKKRTSAAVWETAPQKQWQKQKRLSLALG